MAQQISTYLGIKSDDLENAGVLDTVIGVDTRLYVDPLLLNVAKTPEFKTSRQKIEKHYGEILLLVSKSEKREDRAWRGAKERLVFHELPGTAIGHSAKSDDGRGIGPILGERLLQSASEIIRLGISDPVIFELLGLFEEDFGADRLSDMTIRIISEDLFEYTDRMSKELGLKDLADLKTAGKTYQVPHHPSRTKPLIFLPTEILQDLPVAQSWDAIDAVAAHNQALRQRINEMVAGVWGKRRRIPKPDLRKAIFENPDALRELIRVYRASRPKPYDFATDPAGEVKWYFFGKDSADRFPLTLAFRPDEGLPGVERVVESIVSQFKRNIEDNGLREHLFREDGSPLHERYSQRLFFAAADTYCAANNLDLSREPNGGNGPVDFKVSSGYDARVLVEIKLSSNPHLVQGFENQLPTYEKSENTTSSVYVVIRVTESEAQIKHVQEIHNMARAAGKKVPKLVIIDATEKPSASKRRA
jgi:hypothetical protein